MPEPALSDIVFAVPSSHNFSTVLGDLKRANLSITNRVRSITEDAAFVRDASNAFRRPVVSNERCGSWYIEPSAKIASSYFKSTDGHLNQWGFSTRRLNVHLLDLIGKHDG
jgi:tRNA A64-2'-O-ribosylphosphate transferase